MKELFDLKNRRVTVAPQTLLIPEFKDIWDADTSEHKEVAMNELAYVYYISDYKSPYLSSLTPDLVAQTVAKDFMKDANYEPNELIMKAIAKYKELQLTPSMLLLNASLKTVHNLIDYMENVDLQERDQHGKPIYKPNDVTTSLAKIGGIVDSINKVRSNVEREIMQTAQLRGQRVKGNREDPN